jgi:hypothetical protein
LTKYSTRRNSQGLVNFIPEPEKVYRRRLNKLTSRRILDHLGFESISDIHLLFNNSSLENSLEMDDLYKPCDFTAINGYPHAILEKALEKLPSFKVTMPLVLKHISRLFRFVSINGVCAHNHEDVKMKLFVLSLEEDAHDGFQICR